MPRTQDIGYKPVWDVEPWQADAACNTADPELFYVHADETGGSAARTRRIREAKRICLACPVLTDCADFADRVNDAHAILAATTPDERGFDRQGHRVA